MFKVTQDVKKKYNEENQQRKEHMIESSIEAQEFSFQHEQGQNKVTTGAIAKLNDQQMTVQELWGRTFINQYKGVNIANIYNTNNYANIAKETKLTDAKINEIRQYSQENQGRSEKRRKHHVKRANHYANQLEEKRRDFLKTNDDFIEMRGRYNLQNGANFNEKNYAKLCQKKITSELELLEENYKLEVHAFKIEGNKDADEQGKLDEMRKVCLAKKISALNVMKTEAQKHPQYLSEAQFDKQIKELEKEFLKLDSQVSEQTKQLRGTTLTHVEKRISDRRNERENAQMRKLASKWYLDNYKEEIEATKNALLNDAPQEELEWRKTIITEEWVANALSETIQNKECLEKHPEKFTDRLFIFKANCLHALYFEKTKIDFPTKQKLLKVGVTEAGCDRVVRSQLKTVRKMKDGTFASKQDELNEQWNQKWINSFFTNNMEDRKQCIKDNMQEVLNTKLTTDSFANPDDLMNDFDDFLRFERIVLCQSNLAGNAEFEANAETKSCSGVYSELKSELFHTIKHEGANVDESDYLVALDDTISTNLIIEKGIKISNNTLQLQAPPKEYLPFVKERAAQLGAALKSAK